MPIASPKIYKEMIASAKKNNYAFPAINVTSTETATAALQGFADAKSDGIIQISTGGGEFASGPTIKNMALGAIALAEYVHRVAASYNIYVALHTDHCQADKVAKFINPLIEETSRRRKMGLENLFHSHMFDGSELPLEENMKIAQELLRRCTENEILLEVEAGVVGGEEDGVNNEHSPAEKLYTTEEDMLQVADALFPISDTFMFAATFGNVHGVYKPGNVKLKPTILREGQAAVVKKYGKDKSFNLVFHGGSGSELSEIHETLNYGVIKMNIDTDAQYAFSRPIVDHILKNYDGMLKIDGEVGNKKLYDPRAYLKAGIKGMADRIKQACFDLKSNGQTLYK
jgi:fructose-bisphosphate aldolase class II